MTTTPGDFINLRPSERHQGYSRVSRFYQAEVADSRGNYYLLDGVWAKTEDEARERFAKIADQWTTFDNTPNSKCEACGAEFRAYASYDKLCTPCDITEWHRAGGTLD